MSDHEDNRTRVSIWYERHNGDREAMAACFEDEEACVYCHPELNNMNQDAPISFYEGPDTLEEGMGWK